MLIIQLNPVLPVKVVEGLNWKGPTGNGMAIGWFQPNIEHHLTWIVIMDETGECWEVENPNIRGRLNITWGRTPEKSKD